MKKEIFVLVLLSISIDFTQAKVHELNFGLFELFEKDQSYFMEIRLDRTNLVEAVSADVGGNKEDWNCALSQYLNTNMHLSLNGAQSSFEYLEFIFLEDVIVVTTKLDLPLQEIFEIKIENTVLLETIRNQTNIIKASFHDKKRSFRLDKDRVSTIIKYKL